MEIYDYNDFLKYIKEGLISTHNYKKYENSIIFTLSGYGLKFKLEPINDYKFILIVFNMTSKYQEVLLSIVNNYGYYPSQFTILLNNNLLNTFKFELNKFISETSKDNIKEVRIAFESKYDEGLYKNTLEIPDKLYHITKKIYLDKILNIGLVPKSKNRLSKHPGRIHFVYSIDDAKILMKKLIFSDMLNNLEKAEYVILEIDVKDKSIIRLNTDPNMTDGCFTYDNIPKDWIKVI